MESSGYLASPKPQDSISKNSSGKSDGEEEGRIWSYTGTTQQRLFVLLVITAYGAIKPQAWRDSHQDRSAQPKYNYEPMFIQGIEEFGAWILRNCVVPVCDEEQHAHSTCYIADNRHCCAKDAVHEDRTVATARYLFAHAKLRHSIADLTRILNAI